LTLYINLRNTCSFALGKDSIKDKDHKATRRFHVNDYQNSSLASKRTTYRINMPAKVAKLILPQMTNKNQETIIRIYPDTSAPAQNQSSANYMLSLSYKKLNDEDVSNKLKIGRRACYYGHGPGCCSACCPGCKCSHCYSVVHGFTSNLTSKPSILFIFFNSFISLLLYCSV